MKEKGIERFARWLERFIGRVINWFFLFGIFAVMAMMILTVLDVFLRLFFNAPILGVYELSEYMMVILIFTALPYTERVAGHVKVDLFISRFSKRTQGLIESVTSLLGISLLLLIGWGNIKLAHSKWSFGEITGSLPIPTFPMHLFIAFGAILFCLAMIIYVFNSIVKAIRG